MLFSLTPGFAAGEAQVAPRRSSSRQARTTCPGEGSTRSMRPAIPAIFVHPPCVMDESQDEPVLKIGVAIVCQSFIQLLQKYCELG
jgi:hypothetical protein